MRTVALADIAEKIDYGVTASAQAQPIGPKFLRITDIQDDAVDWDAVPFCEATARQARDAALASGDIVFARTGATTGKSYLVDVCPEGAVFASYLIRVRPSDEVNAAYLARFFQSASYWSQIASKANGAAQPGVNASKLSELLVPLPPLPQQQRIAAILDQADALNRLRQLSISRLAALQRSIFYSHQTSLNQSTRPLLEVCNKITDGTHQAPTWANSGIPFIFVSNVRGQAVSLKTEKFVNEETYKRLTRNAPIEPGDVLYTCVGSYGHAALAPHEPFLFQRHIAHLKPNLEHILPEYLVQLLESPEVRHQADRFATGIAQKTVTLSTLKGMQIRVPDIGQQQKIIEKLRNIRSIADQQTAMGEASQNLFRSLQHRAFSGRL